MVLLLCHIVQSLLEQNEEPTTAYYDLIVILEFPLRKFIQNTHPRLREFRIALVQERCLLLYMPG